VGRVIQAINERIYELIKVFVLPVDIKLLCADTAGPHKEHEGGFSGKQALGNEEIGSSQKKIMEVSGRFFFWVSKLLRFDVLSPTSRISTQLVQSSVIQSFSKAAVILGLYFVAGRCPLGILFPMSLNTKRSLFGKSSVSSRKDK
jgi:hypothetical protein